MKNQDVKRKIKIDRAIYSNGFVIAKDIEGNVYSFDVTDCDERLEVPNGWFDSRHYLEEIGEAWEREEERIEDGKIYMFCNIVGFEARLMFRFEIVEVETSWERIEGKEKTYNELMLVCTRCKCGEEWNEDWVPSLWEEDEEVGSTTNIKRFASCDFFDKIDDAKASHYGYSPYDQQHEEDVIRFHPFCCANFAIKQGAFAKEMGTHGIAGIANSLVLLTNDKILKHENIEYDLMFLTERTTRDMYEEMVEKSVYGYHLFKKGDEGEYGLVKELQYEVVKNFWDKSSKYSFGDIRSEKISELEIVDGIVRVKEIERKEYAKAS